MSFKTVEDLKAEIKQEAASKTLNELREDVAQTIKNNVMFGGYQIDYYAPIGTNTDSLEIICSELSQLGYKAQMRTGNDDGKYILLTVEY